MPGPTVLRPWPAQSGTDRHGLWARSSRSTACWAASRITSVSIQLSYAIPAPTRWGASSARRECDKDSTPALEAQYTLIIGAVPMDAREALRKY